jgi:glucosylceramidase
MLRTQACRASSTSRRLISILVSSIALFLSACGGASSGGSAPSPGPSSSGGGVVTGIPGPSVTIYQTTSDQSKLVQAQPVQSFNSETTASIIINVDPAKAYQSMLGFGAAMTDASANVINRSLSASDKSALLSELFGPAGLRLSVLRLTIGASDFSSKHYSYDDMPTGQTDVSLTNFSIAPALIDVAPLVKAAQTLNPQLKTLASPWSAPGWMKSSGTLIGGSLNPVYYAAYANYLNKYASAMQVEGIPIYALTVQNEPGFSPADYPGMLFDAPSRATFIGEHLGPLLSSQTGAPKIIDYDHNWDAPSSPLTVLANVKAASYVSGVAWHCYAGNVTAQSQVHDEQPTKDTYFTECSGTNGDNWGGTFSWNMRNLVIGATRNWARTVVLWNLALDQNNGPHLGGCANCRGLVTVNTSTAAITRNVEYYVFKQISPYVRPGAVRIASDTGVSGLLSVAFKNADDGSIALIVLNDAMTPQSFAVRYPGQGTAFTLPAGSAATFVWKP